MSDPFASHPVNMRKWAEFGDHFVEVTSAHGIAVRCATLIVLKPKELLLREVRVNPPDDNGAILKQFGETLAWLRAAEKIIENAHERMTFAVNDAARRK